MRVERLPPASLAERAALWMADRVWAAVSDRGVAHVAVSGGSTPGAMFAALAELVLPWEQVHVWQIDERAVAEGDPDRNAAQLALLAATVHPMPVAGDLGTGARAYAAEMAAVGALTLDVVHLGLGDDGHTASWPPGRVPAIGADVAVVRGFRGHDRLTLTPSAVARARERMFLVSGPAKAGMLARLLAADPALPASLVPAERTTVLTDIPI